MAVQWADNFQSYGLGASSRNRMLEGLVYAILGSIAGDGVVVNDPDPNASDVSRAFSLGTFGNAFNSDVRIALPNPVAGTVGVCLRLWLNNIPASDSARPNFIQFQDLVGTNFVQCRVSLNGGVQIIGRVGGSNTVVADSIAPLITPSAWNHFEAIHNGTTGEGSLRLNGVEVLTWTGVDTVSPIGLINLSKRNSASSATTSFIKDLVIWDDTGSENNSAMGTVSVFTLRPDSDSTLGGWVPSTGSNGFSLLAKSVPNDATFISADDSPPSFSEFEIQNLPPDITSVRALLTFARARKVDGGDGNLQTGLTGTLTDFGADNPITSAFTYWWDVSELSPDTGSAWTPVEVDAVKLRIDRTI